MTWPNTLDNIKLMSLRAERSNLPPSIAGNGGDCFVAPLLTMTLGAKSNIVEYFIRPIR